MAVDKKHREEQDLERYGVWVKAGPDEINDNDSTSLELMDIEDSDHDELLITEEEEKLLGELEESSLPDFSDFDESFDTDLSDDSFDIPIVSTGKSDIESKELLHKIENELSALRGEIRQLKDELTGLRVPPVSQAQADEGESGGFFEEEEDETIALTGDELDNILDPADMTEETAESDITDLAADDIGEEISFDDEDSIDLSDDFTELSLDDVEDFEIEETEEEDPALSILGSPDEPDTEGDPESIEIDIPGVDETVDLDNLVDEPVVNIDDIEMEDLEEITDLDDFGLDETETVVIESAEMPPIEEVTDEKIITESFDDDAFDEGEEVEIDLTDADDDLAVIDDSEILDVEMEEISLDDFGIKSEETEEEESDVLAVMDEDAGEEIDLSADSDDKEFEEIEDIDLETVLADSIDAEEGEEGEEADEVIEELEDLSLDEIEEIEEISLDEIDDIDLKSEDIESEVKSDNFEDIEIEEIGLSDSMEEEEPLEEILLEEIDSVEISDSDNTAAIDEIPEISLDDAIDEIETVEEFTLEDSDDEAEIIEDLELDPADIDDEIQVTLPDDNFNELPGTEEVDLESLEALAAAPDLTEKSTEEIIELTELELSDSVDSPEPAAAGIREQTKAALEISSLPGELKEEIKDVLRYMDQLLESLPDDKIQEFARSEHYEVYKKIFEELGISD